MQEHCCGRSTATATGQILLHDGSTNTSSVHSDASVIAYRYHCKVIFFLNITLVGERACKFCLNLCLVEIPEGVESINREAFYQCMSLETATFPSTLRRIGNSAFVNCVNLENVDLLHTSIREIESFAFEGCTKLRSFAFHTNLQEFGNRVFTGCFSLVPSSTDLKSTPDVVAFLRLPEDDRRKAFGCDHGFWQDSDEEPSADFDEEFDPPHWFHVDAEGDY